MDRDLTFDEVIERREVLHQAILACGETIAEALVPAFQRVKGAVNAIYSAVIQLRRVQLYADLTRRWRMSECFAHWLAARWPERWLPELRFTE